MTFAVLSGLQHLIAYAGMTLMAIGIGACVIGLPIFYLRAGGELPDAAVLGWAGLWGVSGAAVPVGLVVLLLSRFIPVPRQPASSAESDRLARLNEAKRELSKLEGRATDDLNSGVNTYADRMALQENIKYLESLAEPLAAEIAQEQEAKKAARDRKW